MPTPKTCRGLAWQAPTRLHRVIYFIDNKALYVDDKAMKGE
jgi:hypothetical protein